MVKQPKVQKSSGNVYADLGFANPELEWAKANVAREIRSIIDIRGLTHAEAGKFLGIDQAEVSSITRGRLGGYSLVQLITLSTYVNADADLRASEE